MLSYYGLFRVGELAKGEHPIKACDVFISKHKGKMLFILRMSKTHGVGSKPQKVKIHKVENSLSGHFCPFKLAEDYLLLRGDYKSMHEQFFVFRNKSPVKSANVRATLKKAVNNLNLDQRFFDTHGLRVGRACNLLKAGYTIDQIKIMGRWKSNAVYRYLQD